jgi:hypothetical protein
MLGVTIDRYYDPGTDQFLSVDPAVATTGQPYAFTGDDPLNATDPLGLGPGLNPQTWTRKHLPNVRSKALRKYLRILYQETDKMPGGTAAALREEARTGKPVGNSFHEVKAIGVENGLGSLVESNELPTRYDRLVARAALADLSNSRVGWDTAAAGGRFDEAASNNLAGLTQQRIGEATDRFESSIGRTAIGAGPGDPAGASATGPPEGVDTPVIEVPE